MRASVPMSFRKRLAQTLRTKEKHGSVQQKSELTINMTIVKLLAIMLQSLPMAKQSVMREVAISEFKAKCLALIEQVQKTKQPIRITRFGKPVAEVVPSTVVMDRQAWFDSMKDTFEILGDIVSPAIDEDEWEMLRD